MDAVRRSLVNRCAQAGALALALAGGLLKPVLALAAEWNKLAFDAGSIAEALKQSGAIGAFESPDLLLKVQEHAENGAVVQLEVSSRIPGTTSIAIFVEKNPRPLVADVNFVNGAEPYIFLVTKMAETSRIRAVARAGGKSYFTVREVSVTTSGC